MVTIYTFWDTLPVSFLYSLFGFCYLALSNTVGRKLVLAEAGIPRQLMRCVSPQNKAIYLSVYLRLLGGMLLSRFTSD